MTSMKMLLFTNAACQLCPGASEKARHICDRFGISLQMRDTFDDTCHDDMIKYEVAKVPMVVIAEFDRTHWSGLLRTESDEEYLVNFLLRHQNLFDAEF